MHIMDVNGMDIQPDIIHITVFNEIVKSTPFMKRKIGQTNAWIQKFITGQINFGRREMILTN